MSESIGDKENVAFQLMYVKQRVRQVHGENKKTAYRNKVGGTSFIVIAAHAKRSGENRVFLSADLALPLVMSQSARIGSWVTELEAVL